MKVNLRIYAEAKGVKLESAKMFLRNSNFGLTLELLGSSHFSRPKLVNGCLFAPKQMVFLLYQFLVKHVRISLLFLQLFFPILRGHIQ